jgi:signal transduction histidine kinase
MSSLPLRLALLFCALFGLLAVLAVLATLGEPAAPWLFSIEGLLGAMALALAAAWFTLLPLLRRIARLGDALESFRQDGYRRAPMLTDANADALSQLAAQTEQLAQHAVDQADQLDRAVRQRRELLANMSHDLRTPLASMQGYLELLLLRDGSLEPAEARNYLQTAARHSVRLARLVRDLFELTRLESGDLKPNPEAFALAELTQDVVQKFAAEAQRREVTLCSHCDALPGATMVQADIALIERVLENLVENALHHTPAGGLVTIELSGEEAQAGIAVCDTGEGFVADAPGDAFEPYERASRVGGRGADARTGLGLAIARRIVGLHGSKLLLHSAPGQGTRVSFALSLAERRPLAAPAVTA